MDEILTGSTTQGQSGPGRSDNESVTLNFFFVAGDKFGVFWGGVLKMFDVFGKHNKKEIIIFGATH